MPAPTNSDHARIAAWPALSRFYGLSIAELYTTPRAILEYYEEQMPVLQAREQLAANLAADWPHAKDTARKRAHKELLEEAGWSAPAPVHPTRSVTDLGAIGIKVVMEPPKGEVSEAA